MSQPEAARPPDSTVPPVQQDRQSTVTSRTLMSHVDRRIAAVSHLSIAFGVLIGVGFMLGIAINLVIWLRSKRSPFVELHAEQAGAYQLTVLLINALIVIIWIAGLVPLVGGWEVGLGQTSLRPVMTGLWCVLVPLFAVWFFGTILLGVYGGLVVAAGGNFAYPIFGPWAHRRLAAKGKMIEG